MPSPQPSRRYRFGVFEADATTGELRRQGVRIRLHSQPFQILVLLLESKGALLTREEICRELWPGDTFVDYEHGVNSAVNRLREALGDRASSPRFIETLARRGYRFVAPVQRIEGERMGMQPLEAVVEAPEPPVAGSQQAAGLSSAAVRPMSEDSAGWLGRFLARPEDLPRSPHAIVQTLFLLLQLMYLAFYIGALANLPEISDLLSALPSARHAFATVIVTAAVLIPVRTFLLCAALFHAPGLRQRFLRLWPFLLVMDALWALSPALLLHHINYGVALACMTLLVYSPFAQRSLLLMGAGAEQPAAAVL